MSRGSDAATLLARALLANAEAAGCPVRIAAADWTRWASVTFSGTRHLLTLEAAPSPALDRWLSALPEAEFGLRGHLVAELAVERICREGAAASARIEVLTVEER
jgi:hypothetical protein